MPHFRLMIVYRNGQHTCPDMAFENLEASFRQALAIEADARDDPQDPRGPCKSIRILDDDGAMVIAIASPPGER